MGGSQNRNASVRELFSNFQGRLTTKLTDNTFRFFLLINAQDIFHRERFKVELVRCVVISRNRFRVAVDHDRFIPFVPNRKGRMHAAVIKFDALANSVGAAP